MKLDRDFFSQDTNLVTELLLGKVFNYNNKSAIIIETEGYKSNDDPASHAYKGKTKRNELMFGFPGIIYVYLIYGLHHCLNIVTDVKPGAVLIRGVMALSGEVISGPGRVAKYYQMTRKDNGQDVIGNNYCYVKDIGLNLKYSFTSRIGITKGIDKLWRCLVDNNKALKEQITYLEPKKESFYNIGSI
jgi:DNA-3-methyladenine glycosylase